MKKLLLIVPLLTTGCVGYKINPELDHKEEASIFSVKSYSGTGEIYVLKANGIEIPEFTSVNRHALEIQQGSIELDLNCRGNTRPNHQGFAQYKSNFHRIKFDAIAGESYFLYPIVDLSQNRVSMPSSFLSCNDATGECTREVKHRVVETPSCQVKLYSYPDGKQDIPFDYIIKN